jgi:hypothetical protein
MPNPFTLRRRSSSQINPDLESREVQFQVRNRPPTPRGSWFTRKNRRRQIVPVFDDNIVGTEQIPMASVEISRQNSNSSRNEDYPSIKEINLDEVPVTDVVSPADFRSAEVVGNEGSDCCIPGFSSIQNCRICPERLQPERPRPGENVTRRNEKGGRKRKRTSRRTKRRRQRQLKKRHYSRRK